jgi:acyl carrier protein
MSEQAESDRLRLRSVFSRVFQIPIASLPATIDTEAIAAWDSLAHLSLIEEIEQEFGIRFSQAEAITMFSEADIIRVLTGKAQK